MNDNTDPKIMMEISERTIAHYEMSAQAFWEGTQDHDVSQNMQSLVQALKGDGPHHLLDLGCGPGRDLLAFQELGYKVTGLDGCARFCEMARKYAQCEVLQQDFLRLDLPDETFDGIFANAVLFHIPSQEIIRVMKELRKSLKPNGILFSSNPRGENQEGWNGTRYGTYYDLERWREILKAASFMELHHYYRPPGLPREQQPWLASVWRKV
jgi:SAM-dependent methyltransferase